MLIIICGTSRVLASTRSHSLKFGSLPLIKKNRKPYRLPAAGYITSTHARVEAILSFNLLQKQNAGFLSLLELGLLTRRLQIDGHDEAHYGQDHQVHDAGDAEEEPYQAVIHTGDISPEPAVAPGGGHGQRVHGHGRSQVRHRQVHAQQLRRLHFGRPFDRRDDDEQVSHDGENSCGAREEETEEGKSGLSKQGCE